MKQRIPGIEDKAAEDKERGGGQSEAGVSERRGNEKSKAEDEDPMCEYTPSRPDEEESLVIDDDTVLQELLDSLKTPTPGSEKDAPAISPRRAPESSPSEQAAVKKLRRKRRRRCLRPCHKQPRREPGDEQEGREGDRARSSVRVVGMVVGGVLLEDGDESIELPDQRPELSPEEVADVEDEATVEEVQRLIGMQVLMRPKEIENMKKSVVNNKACDGLEVA